MPCALLKRFAKKISARKIIILHEMVDVLLLPVFYFALEQLQVLLWMPAQLIVYCSAVFISMFLLFLPFLIVLFVYNNRHEKRQVEIF